MFFSSYINPNGIPTVLYYKNYLNEDWYEYRKKLNPDLLKIIVDSDDNVLTWSYDSDRLKPDSVYVYEVKDIPDDFFSTKDWLYQNGKLLKKREFIDYTKELQDLLFKIQYCLIINSDELKKLQEKYKNMYEEYISSK